MKKENARSTLLCILGSLILAGTIMLVQDLYSLWTYRSNSCVRFLLAFAALTVLFAILFRKRPKLLCKVGLLFLAFVCFACVCVALVWRQASVSSGYPRLDDGKSQLYADKRVMFLVPHEDDDLNLMSGVLDAYVHYGSTVYPVFVTNGDYFGIGQTRIKEALSVMERIGIPAENVIFLGYGDQYPEDTPHIYNSRPEQLRTSYTGFTATYGIDTHPPFRDGRDYTAQNFFQDIHDVIWTYKPDVLFCSDYDNHADHRSVCLAFEKVMGQLLKEHPDYRPLVFKGYAYATAWEAAPDFYAINLLSTQKAKKVLARYPWEDRVRMPLLDDSLAHSLFRCETTKQLALYRSQYAFARADSMINGDKVFWSRDTNSLCYAADIQVSSGDGSLLNDFMLLDSSDVTDGEHLPADGTWVPTDSEKTAAVNFPAPCDIACIRLYDDPSPTDNVLRCILTFSDGSQMECGPLPAQGAPLTIPVEKKGVSFFTVQLVDVEGDQAGLTEIEAFSAQPDPGLRYVKLMDAQENFLYDYCITEGETVTLYAYCPGLTAEEIRALSVQTDNDRCPAVIREGVITLTCPRGEATVLTLQLDGTDLSDTVRVSHPAFLTRHLQSAFRYLDKAIYTRYSDYSVDPALFLSYSAVYKAFTFLLKRI